MHCLEQQPEQRPQSVYQVLAALPGGDPLAAALGIILSGPGIARGRVLERARLLDLAPTLLHLLDVSVPADMDGRILHDAIGG